MSRGIYESVGIRGIHHAQLTYPLALQAEITYFYTELLGLPRLQGLASGLAEVLHFLAGGQRIDLVPRQQIALGSGPEHGHLALQVSGLGELQQRLLDAGGPVLGISRVADGQRCYVKDPAGNLLELLELEPQLMPRAR